MSNSTKKAGTLLVALTVAAVLGGCSTGGSTVTESSTEVTTTTTNGGGNNNNPPPPALSKQFTVANFRNTDSAILILGSTPGPGGASSQTVSATSNRQLAPSPSSIPVAKDEADGPSKDLPSDVRQKEKEALDKILAQGVPKTGAQLQRFQQLNEGDTVSLFATGVSTNVVCKKMHADSETLHCTILAEVVGGNPVINKATALAVAQAFDTNNPFLAGQGIYDQVRNIYGSEWTANGGRDGDAKINLVFLSSSSIGGSSLFGFFRPTDEYPVSTAPTSNQGEFLYLNAGKASGDLFDVLSTVAHEFQHMCAYNVKLIHNGLFDGTQEDVSLDEGRAVLCEDLLGYGLNAQGGGSSFVFTVTDGFLRNPGTFPMFSFGSRNGDYGKGYLLWKYLYERFGATAFADVVQSNDVGLTELDNFTGNFDPVFTDWTQALLGSTLGGTLPSSFIYPSGFRTNGTFNIRGRGQVSLAGPLPSQTFGPSGSPSVTVPAYSATYFAYTNGTGAALNIFASGDAGATANLILQRPVGTFAGAQ